LRRPNVTDETSPLTPSVTNLRSIRRNATDERNLKGLI